MVPEGWCTGTVADCSLVLDSQRVPLNASERAERPGPYPYWGANGVVDHVDGFIFDEPLVLIAEDGGFFSEAAHRPIAHRVDGRVWVNNHAHVLRVVPPASRDWFYFWFVHRDITPFINGGTRSKLNQGDLKQLPILLPPIAEQLKIAAILSSVDETIAATQSVIEQTDRVKLGLLQTLMTRGIGHTRFKQTEIGEIPQDWEVVALEEVSEHVTKGATPTTYGYDWSEEDDGGVLFLRSECVSEDGFSREGSAWIPVPAHESMARSVVRRGDVLITITGNVGRVAQIPDDVLEGNINQHIARVRVNRADLTTDFVHFALQTKHQRARFERIVTGLAYPQLSLKQIRETLVPVPSAREQNEIVQRLKHAVRTLDEQRHGLANLQTLKRGLLQDLLTGRVRVTAD